MTKPEEVSIPENTRITINAGKIIGIRRGKANRVVVTVSGQKVFSNLMPPPINPNQFKVGQRIENKGIYLGIWEPEDKNGRTLGKTFDLYAAPEDIRNGSGNLLMTFNNAVKHVAGLRNYHGHDGGNFENEKAVLKAVRNNPKALAKWFIPTREILHGKTRAGDKIQLVNLYDSRNRGAFKNTFITKSNSFSPSCYWSLTECFSTIPRVYVVGFRDGDAGWHFKEGDKLSTRLVRAELRL